MPKKTPAADPAQPDPPGRGRVVPFPGHKRPCQQLRLPDPTIITFPFSKAECDIINRHLRERSPEICDGIADTGVREIVERFIEYVWRERQALAASLVWLLLALPVLHAHAWGVFGKACVGAALHCLG